MKRTAALRIAGDICFYFSVLSLFLVFQPWAIPMACFALACLLVGLVAVGLQSLPLRLVLSLLPGVCFAFTKLSTLLILPGLAWLYFILYVTIGRFGIAIYDYRSAYRWMLLISAFVIAVHSISFTLFNGAALPLESLGYLAAFMLLGVVAMRGMQMNAKMDLRWHTANVIAVACSLLLAVGVSLLLYQLFVHSRPLVLLLVSPLRRALRWLFSLFRFDATAEAPIHTPAPTAITNTLPTGSMFVATDETFSKDEPEIHQDTRFTDQALTVGAFLIICVLLFVAVWLIVKLARRGKALAAERAEFEQTEAYTPDRKRRKAKPEVVHGRAQTVRKIYRDYLDYLRENGLQRTASDTSEEILTESERMSGASMPEEETLRRVYLKARYGAATVTEDDVAAARASFDAIRSRGKV